jgi:hypothetical protein
MKNQQKKIASVVELNKQELKYLLCGVGELSKTYIAHCNRDFNTEDLHDKVKAKLETALASFND